MPYTLHRLVAEDGAFIEQTSHWDTRFTSGARFAENFEVPVAFEVDVDIQGRRMPTLFTVPAFLAKRDFVDLLRRAGADNIDAYPTVIVNPETGETIRDYWLLNVIGMVSSVNLEASEYTELGPDLLVIDEIVLDDQRTTGAHICRLLEDPQHIVVSDELAKAIEGSQLGDIYLERIEGR